MKNIDLAKKVMESLEAQGLYNYELFYSSKGGFSISVYLRESQGVNFVKFTPDAIEMQDDGVVLVFDCETEDYETPAREG